MSEKFCLKWNDFQSTVSQSFGILRKEKDFYDVTLVSDDEIQIPAHKLVLSASSDFFKKILRSNTHSHPLLYLSGVNSASLSFVLDYIYQGEVLIYQDDLDSFLNVAQKLKIEGLLSNGDTTSDGSFNNQKQDHETEYKANKFNNDDDYDVKDIIIDELIPRKGMNIKPSQNRIVATSVNSITMSEADDKVQQLIKKGDGMNYCKVCDYKSNRMSNLKEHVEIHIEGLSYSCQFWTLAMEMRHPILRHIIKYYRSPYQKDYVV